MTTQLVSSSEAPKVFFSHDRLVTTSQAIADYFDKQHKHVLAKIDSLDCSPEFTSANFSAHAENQLIGVAEREIRYFEITKDGFMFLVMGFTGKKAARLKEAYISKFNAMEAELHAHPTSGRRGSYSIVIDFENDLPICSRVLNPGEIVMSYESFMEHALRMGNVVLPCDEVGKFTMDELQEITAQAKRTRDHWQKQYSDLERKYSN
ncbi:Rha family transcriptional regulator [Yokenella regensburgei]|uniref:Rha family transcriptional regulator n=1 Tax=Yokenella regensburgei TaxID=158877 RepID=UPI001375BA92|nr:Rha family transcriptional regulator [Yokenella regensburgei]KAF1368523.1 Rha family phage regulatory protein [Yokenella regensburgei]